MKKRFLATICTILFICCFLTGCKKTCAVTIVSTPVETTNSQGIYAQLNADKYNKTFTIKVEKDGIVGTIDVPSPEYVTFCGWYTDKSYTYQWNPAIDTVKGDMTLYAKWERK
jgi:uncharacterized repeat protein (TIGR02543 family)